MYTPRIRLKEKQMAVLLAAMVAIMPFSIDAYLPSIPQIAGSLHADIHYIERSLSSFVFGVAAGQLAGGALSDIKGRRNIALLGLFVYLLSSLALIFVQNADQLMLMRAVQALGGGMSAVVVGAIVRDNYQGRQAAQMFALIGIITLAAPLAAPMIGAQLQKFGGWRSVFAFLFGYALLVSAALWFFLPQHKAAEPLKAAQIRQIFSRYGRVLANRPSLGFLFYHAATFSAMMVFLTESSFVYIQLYGLTPSQFAWAFGCNILTMMTLNRLTAWLLRKGYEPRQILPLGTAVQLGANLILVSAVQITGLPPFWLLLLPVMFAVGAQGMIVANTQALFMGSFKQEIGGSANAVLTCFQSLLAAAASFLTTKLHNGTASTMAVMMFATSLTGFVLLMLLSHRQLGKGQPENQKAA